MMLHGIEGGGITHMLRAQIAVLQDNLAFVERCCTQLMQSRQLPHHTNSS
jgi:hypothetical protein